MHRPLPPGAALLAGLLLPLLAAPALAQGQYLTIATETFDYPGPTPLGGLNGGTGWWVPWYSGANGDNAIVNVPGLDPVGGKATTSCEHCGSFRTLDVAGFDPILDNLRFGLDGTTVWISFLCVREPYSDDWYGGISLYEQWVGEKLLIGSPWSSDEWGVDVPWVGVPTFIPGTNCWNQALLVARIDFLPGDERVQMWVDPPNTHPTTVADLDVMVPDFRFNEIRLQSGSGGQAGFTFDDIVISTPDFRPAYAVTNLVAGGTATFTVSNAAPGATVVIGWSITGAGPTPTRYGDVAMSPPIQQLPTLTADPQSVATTSLPVPPAAAGLTVYTQAVAIDAGGTGILSNPLVEVVQ